ncbi:MAG: Fic family protein [Rhodobacter sp.]|nr:Fic family protein [Rhodobacter sp.]
MHYRLTLADALDVHAQALEFGGRPGIHSLHMMASALCWPYSGYHRSIARKAAALLHSMVGIHGVVDANKRTAWMLVRVLLCRCGYELKLDPGTRIDDLVVSVADGTMTYDGLVLWFRSRTARIRP